MIGNRRHFTAAGVGAAALVTVLSGCAGGTTTSPAPSSTTPTTSAAATTTAAAAGTFTDAQVQQLCSDMEAELQNWRTVTPTLGKGALNLLIGTWASQNGINLLDLAAHRDRIDAAMATTCPEIRDGALYALEIPDLASGMVGF